MHFQDIINSYTMYFQDIIIQDIIIQLSHVTALHQAPEATFQFSHVTALTLEMIVTNGAKLFNITRIIL